MFFAFAYKAAGEFGSVPFFGSAGHGSLSQDLFLQLCHDDHRRVRQPAAGRQSRPDICVLEAVTGQLFPVVAVGKIISSMPRRGERPGS